MLEVLESAGDKLRRSKALDRAVRGSHHVEEAERLLRLGLEQLALGHVTSVSRYCSDKFKHCDLPRFTLWDCIVFSDSVARVIWVSCLDC